jgi:hypothetical protein
MAIAYADYTGSGWSIVAIFHTALQTGRSGTGSSGESGAEAVGVTSRLHKFSVGPNRMFASIIRIPLVIKPVFV